MAQCKGSDDIFQVALFGVDSFGDIIVASENTNDLFILIVGKLGLIVNRNLPKEHIILCQSPCFIREDVLDSSKFLRTVAVSGDCALDRLILVDEVGIEEFGEVEVDPHGDGDDGAQKDQHSHELNGKVYELNLLQQQEHNSQEHHYGKQDF